MVKNKKKILIISDHALSTSGVGCQTRYLANGLVSKGDWTIRQFGAAIKHQNYNTIAVNEDFIIKPIDGFGNRELLLQALATEKPDVLLIFTDPRFFTWLWKIEDEIRNVCPIAYWHVWDNYPYPDFNDVYYYGTDLINCHSHFTYNMLKDKHGDKVNYVPHSLPEDIFYPLKEEEIKKHKLELLGKTRENSFVLFWINRNAKRKRPADVIRSWSIFIKNNKIDSSKINSPILLMHTDPLDQEGPNLFEVAKKFNVSDSVIFSNQRIDFDQVNILHNISDACINIAYAEGFGLATLEAMNCAKPIIVSKTGGLTRQVINHLTGEENGVALDIDVNSCVGSQNIPYILEDYVSVENVAKAIEKIYKMNNEDRKTLGLKARNYALNEFNHQKTIDLWDKSLTKLIDDYKNKNIKRWSIDLLNEY